MKYTEKILNLLAEREYQPAWLSPTKSPILPIMLSKFSNVPKDFEQVLLINFTKKNLDYIKINGNVICIAIATSEKEKWVINNIWNIDNELFDYVFTVDEFEKWINNMKFDKIIMNPPYSSGKGHDSKPLHLKILKEAQSHVNFENGGKVICLHPSKWIKRFDYWNNKWKCFNVEECDFISGIESTKLFGAAIGSELSITVIGKNGTTEYKSFSRFIQWVNDKIIDKAPIKMSDKNSKYRTYNPNEKFILNLPIIHGNTNCFDCTEITSKDFNKALKVAFGKREQDINSLKFDSDVERKNFYDSTFTYFYKFLILICRDGQTSSSCYYALPLMDSYKNEWTDERLCKFFNITDDEFAYMKKVVDDYKQQCEELRK